ncbi:MAG: AAA family ATPase [Thermoplasmata archaeon]|nr:AAA family ATPase [Thermoplasmata archaeon]
MARTETPTSDERLPLAERTRPKRLADIRGNPASVSRLRDWGSAWATSTTPPLRRAAVLAGPPGVGKTTAALAVAAEFGWTVVEMNASDARNQGAIDLVAGRASLSHTLGNTGTYRAQGEGGRSLILLDEADCLTGRATEEAKRKPSPLSLRDFLRGRYASVDALNRGWGLGETGRPPVFGHWNDVPATPGRAAFNKIPAAQADVADWRGSARPVDTGDRGGLGAIARLVRETRQPLVLTVNDESPLTRYSPVFRNGVLRLSFDRLGDRDLTAFLREVAARYSISVGPRALEAIVRRSRGDLRGAVNDLEAIAPLSPGPAQETVLGVRDVGSEIGEFVEEVLAAPRFYRSVELQNRVDANPDDLLPWFEEGAVRLARTPAGVSAGLAAVARAERNLSRARRFRVYGLWSYAGEQMSGGTAVAIAAAGGVRIGHAPFPAFLGEMGRSRATRALRTSTLDKAGEHLHLSRRKGVDLTLPFLERVFGTPGVREGRVFELRRAIVRELRLTPEEVGFLAHVEPDAAGIRALFDSPQNAPEEATVSEESTPVAVEKPKVLPPSERKRVQRSLGEF